MSNYRILVINLARSRDRLAAIGAQLENTGLPFERIDAIDGTVLDDETIRRVAPPELIRKTYHRPLSRAEVACAMSHRKAWQRIVDEDLDFGIVLEDDAILEDHFAETVELIASLPDEHWDFLKLFALKRGGEKNIAKSFDYRNHRFVLFRQFPLGFVGQAISRRGARALTTNLATITEPADGQLKSWWNAGIYPFGLLPYSVSTDFDGMSDINPDSALETIRQDRFVKMANKVRRAAGRLWWTPRLNRRFDEFTKTLP